MKNDKKKISQTFLKSQKLLNVKSKVGCFSLVFLAVLVSDSPVWADLPLLPGQAITTHFSGTGYNQFSPVLSGKVLTVLDIRDPVANGASFAGSGNNWVAPRYQHSSWDAANLGEVFGLALDTGKAKPDIYVTSSSSLYHVDSAFNMKPGLLSQGYGGVFKIDGTTGIVSLLADLPSAPFDNNGYSRYAGLAQIAANPTARVLYVANYEDGKIYILNMDTGAIVETFDHGIQAVSPSIADNGLAGFTALGRRVSAVQYHPVEQRLYYFVWTGINSNKLWSIPVGGNGLINGTARFELNYAGSVITDLAFNKDGSRMLAAQMTTQNDLRSAHLSAGIEWLGSSGSWSLNKDLEGGTGTIPVGMFDRKLNSAGTITYGYNNYGTYTGTNEPCEDSFVLMGDALDAGLSTYGLQITPLTGSTNTTLGQDDYIVDLEGSTGNRENYDKYGLGDVEVLSACAMPPTTGSLAVSKSVKGGSDPQIFKLQLDCSDNSFDDNAISLAAGTTHIVNNIPAGTTCIVIETIATAPSGYNYKPPVINPPQPFTITANNTVMVNVVNELVPKQVDLAVTKLADNNQYKRGEMVTYTITVTNNGPDTATGVKLSDQIPSGVTLVEVEPSQGLFRDNEWSVGTLAVKATATLVLKVTIN